MGQPAGSAVPLVWAHAEYLKLLRSALDGKVFDRIDPVYERYCEKKETRQRKKLEISSKRRPIQRIEAGKTLRILDERKFEVFGARTAGRRSTLRQAAAWAARVTARILPPGRRAG